jgi:hypothetical protein
MTTAFRQCCILSKIIEFFWAHLGDRLFRIIVLPAFYKSIAFLCTLNEIDARDRI